MQSSMVIYMDLTCLKYSRKCHFFGAKPQHLNIEAVNGVRFLGYAKSFRDRDRERASLASEEIDICSKSIAINLTFWQQW